VLSVEKISGEKEGCNFPQISHTGDMSAQNFIFSLNFSTWKISSPEF